MAATAIISSANMKVNWYCSCPGGNMKSEPRPHSAPEIAAATTACRSQARAVGVSNWGRRYRAQMMSRITECTAKAANHRYSQVSGTTRRKTITMMPTMMSPPSAAVGTVLWM